jgi:basic membrane protein A and related proteins
VKKSLLRVGAVAAASLLSLSACAEPPAENTAAPAPADSSAAVESSAPAETEGEATDFKACMVSDFGGFDDKSFNETSYNGLLRAGEELGVETGEIESNAESEYAGNIQSQIDAGCNIVVTVGFALANATEAAAKQNPDVDFAIVDFNSFEGVDNAKGLLFNAAQPSFLAGYAAAAMSETGIVGTFGGANYPTVTIFMDGFQQGVLHHNETKGTDVKVIGWDEAAQDGQFIGGNDPFGDIPGGKNTAATLISQGADIIMPVAGPAGQGALQAAQESGGKVKAIWVDTDGYVSAPEFGSVILTSAEKMMDVAVFEAIKASMEGQFSSEEYVGTLENDGVGLAPFHDFEASLPEGLADELTQLEQQIIDGEIEITSPSQP